MHYHDSKELSSVVSVVELLYDRLSLMLVTLQI